MLGLTEAGLETLCGLIGGIVLGLAARRGRFCTLGAIEDAAYGNDWRRIRMWALALSVAIAASFVLAQEGLLDLSRTLYAPFAFDPLAAICGGLLFGYGMALAGNCGYGALARAGGGDLRSGVIVLVMAVSAAMAMGGPTAILRDFLFPQVPEPPTALSLGYAHAIQHLTGLPLLVPALAIAAALAGFALIDGRFRATRGALFWSVLVGLAIASGWAGTAWIEAHGFADTEIRSHSFTAPLGQTLFFAMTASAGSSGLGFGVGSVAGIAIGAVIGSISKGHFRWEACDDPQELGRQIFGAFLMGTGGVIALGCSVGQGLSAFSILRYSAPVVLAAIVIGALIGLRHLIHGFAPHE
ncbi:MAG: YeeE/YedE family protein [Neomegalonema sp.]|nr:YeeE/YedE family protein [Neomegalonema sp.]